ncbi:bacterio-opsin activator domain-containing protein [Halovivax sp.]|uniref:bacterio-opsin activator domain-containing protein n=1 Tax=Halovivax sp. TaxID=1935978 RepID=UPI0025BB4CE2|nr:bacterio-opsin activator domain-containing protein [Halovivax sp.]
MADRDTLAGATLDELPLTLAVLDADGRILLTNRPWQRFGETEGRAEAEDAGVDYVAAAAQADDEHARRAADGLRSVLDGDRDEFAMEYPCHSPSERRWFTMRANRFEAGGEDRVVVVHLDITERKLAELAVEETAGELRREREALEHVLDRVDGLVRDVTNAAVGARSRGEVERRVCESVVGTDPYVLAWIGRADVAGDRLSPSEWAAVGDVPLEDGSLQFGEEGAHPAVRAVRTGEAQILEDLTDVDEGAGWWPSGAGDAFEAVAAVPLAYGEVDYGVLTVFAADADAFDDPELPVLESLAGTVATAINAIEARRLLTTDSVVELELTIDDRTALVADLSARFETTLTYRGQTAAENGALSCFFEVEGPAEPLREAFEDAEGVDSARTVTEREDGALLEVAVTEGLPAILVERGAVVRRFCAEGGRVELELDLSDGQSARSLYDALSRRYHAVELVRYRERERVPRTPRDVADRIESELTARQLTALQTAYHAGYYRWPREISGEELAASMDISRSTFHQHLRAAERRVLDELFEGTHPSEGESL